MSVQVNLESVDWTKQVTSGANMNGATNFEQSSNGSLIKITRRVVHILLYVYQYVIG